MHLERRLFSSMVILNLLVVTSCQHRADNREVLDDHSSTKERHAVHSIRLRETMGMMNTEIQHSWPQEIETETRRDTRQDFAQQCEKVAKLADSLARSAQSIPSSISDVSMTDGQRDQFLAYVERLTEAALKLRKAADARNRTTIKHSFHEIRQTCTDCHGQFSKISGPLQTLFDPSARAFDTARKIPHGRNSSSASTLPAKPT